MKQIHLKSLSPIEISANDLMDSVNELRKAYADDEANKTPLTLEQFLPTLRVFFNRDADHSMLSFSLSYDDESGIPSTRHFPNFGLEIKSDSKLDRTNDKLWLSVDLLIKASKAKWQATEIAECAKIFSTGDYAMSLLVTLDENTEWGGHSRHVTTLADEATSSGLFRIPPSYFSVESK